MKFISVLQVVVLIAFVIISSKATIIKLEKCMAVYRSQYKNELNANTSTICSSSDTSYYYDDIADECKRYPGCENGNAEITFSSKQDCERICKNVCGEADDNIKEGEYRIEKNCDPYFRRYVYDENSNECKVYYACAGERIIFRKISRCEKLCVKPTSGPTLRPTPRPTSSPGNSIDFQFPSEPTLRPTPRPTSSPGNSIDFQFPSEPTLRPKPRPTSSPGNSNDFQFPSTR